MFNIIENYGQHVSYNKVFKSNSAYSGGAVTLL